MLNTALPASIANLGKPIVYQSCAETAKLIRQALKEAFPEVKFSVRSSNYAGGASIRVGWQDGPTRDQVKAIAGAFEGSTFDGQTDSKTHYTHAFDGQPISFGADYVFCEREEDSAQAAQLAAIFGRADRGAWLTLATRFGIGDSDALRMLGYHPDVREFAAFVLRSLPQPRFDGRRSKTAEKVTLLSHGD